MTKKKIGTAGRFGPRYGKTVRQKTSVVEAKLRAGHSCPYCLAVRKVKRLATGIWTCRKCQSKFAGRAYVPREV